MMIDSWKKSYTSTVDKKCFVDFKKLENKADHAKLNC